MQIQVHWDGTQLIKRVKTMKNLITFALVFTAIHVHAQWLEVHQVGRGDGDSALIIAVDTTAFGIPDTVVVLIDGQRSKAAAASVWNYIQDTVGARFPGRKIIDFIITSHIHQDHFGGMMTIMDSMHYNGWQLGFLDNNNMNLGGVVDQFSLNTSHLDLEGQGVYQCYDSIDYRVVKVKAAQYNAYVNANQFRIAAQPSNNLFHNKGFSNISFICLAANGVTIGMNGEPEVFLDPSGNDKYKVKSENDLSFAWLLSFQGFHYFTGGDIGGGGGGYANGETPIAAYMGSFFPTHNFHVCAMKVSHHGSAHSTNDLFLRATNPTLAVVTGNLRSFRGTALPTYETLNKLNHFGSALRYAFTVNVANPTVADYSNRARFLGYNDVVIKIPQAPGFPGLNQGLQMQVFQVNRDANYNPIRGLSEIIVCNENHQ